MSNKDFRVGDIVVWDETSPNYEYGEPYFGLGPFQIINLCTKEGHISIKKIPEANTGTYTGGEFTCSAKRYPLRCVPDGLSIEHSMRKFNVGDVVDWDEHNGNNRGRYQPGPYVVAEVLGGMGLRLQRTRWFPVVFQQWGWDKLRIPVPMLTSGPITFAWNRSLMLLERPLPMLNA